MKKEIKLGLTVFITVVVAIWGINFMKGRDILSFGGNTYYGVYASINGLTEASPIYYRGFKVGTVRNVDFHPNDPNKFLVTFTLDVDIQLPKDSRAEIYSLDLMGSKAVEIIKGEQLIYMTHGDTIGTSVMGDFKDQVANEVLPLKDKAEKLIVRLDSVFSNLGTIVNKKNKTSIENSLHHFNLTVMNLEQISSNLATKMADDGEIAVLIKRMDAVLLMLARQGPHIDSTFNNLASFSKDLKNSDLNGTIGALKTALAESTTLLEDINKGNGSLGKLMKDEELYLSLNEASINLNNLLIDVQNNPKRYVSFSAIDFGKNVYVNGDSNALLGINYQVVIQESLKPLNMDSVTINSTTYKVFENYRDSKYKYSIATSKSYADTEMVLEQAKSIFKLANMVALENGNEISLKKAKKRTN